MPNVTVYIRKDDLDKWKALPNKAAWISGNLTMTKKDAVESGLLEPNEKLRYAPSENIPVDILKQGKGGRYNGDSPIKFCKHGADPKLCKFAKPGKPCK